MKSKDGFTLVELLSVIIIMSLLMTVAVPATLAISNKIKTKMLDTKLTLAEKQAVLWAQDNRKCFSGNTSNCTSGLLTNCNTSAGATASTDKTCRIKLCKLAEEGYLSYDNETSKRIENPINKNKQCVNQYRIEITYSAKTKNFKAQRVDPATIANATSCTATC